MLYEIASDEVKFKAMSYVAEEATSMHLETYYNQDWLYWPVLITSVLL